MPLEPGATAAPTAKPGQEAGAEASDAFAGELSALMKDGEAKPVEPGAEVEATGEDGAEVEGGDAKPADAKDKADPKTARGLEAIARAQKRFDTEKQQTVQRINRMVSDFEADKTKHAAAVKAAEGWSTRLKADVFSAVIDAMPDLTPEQAELVAKQFYAHAKAPTSPELRMQAQARRQAAEDRARLAEVERKAEEREKAATAYQQKLVAEENARLYVATVEDSITPEVAPLLAKAIKKNQKVTRSELRFIAEKLYERSGVDPEPSEVITEWEGWKRTELRDRYDLDPIAAPQGTTKTPIPVADKTKRPTPISNDLVSATRPQSQLTPEELEEDILRGLKQQMSGSGG